MRAQYHFRVSPRGLLAWDVHRLEPYWSSDGARITCRQVVDHARQIQEADLTFPVILSSDGRVMDGMHRICRALLEGHDEIEAVRFVHDPEPDHIDVNPDDLPYSDIK